MLHSLLYQDHCCKQRLLEKIWIYCDADVWLLVTGKRSIPILGDHGDLLEGWCLRTHIWMPVLSQWGGITGERLKTKEAPAFMNTSKWMHLPSMNTCAYTDFEYEWCVWLLVFWNGQVLRAGQLPLKACNLVQRTDRWGGWGVCCTQFHRSRSTAAMAGAKDGYKSAIFGLVVLVGYCCKTNYYFKLHYYYYVLSCYQSTPQRTKEELTVFSYLICAPQLLYLYPILLCYTFNTVIFRWIYITPNF